MRILANSLELQDLMHKTPCLIVKFGAQTCAPCHTIQQKIAAWCAQYNEVEYLYIPIEKFGELAAQASVFVVPTVQVYVEGKMMAQESGYFSLDMMLEKVQQYLDLLKA